MSDFGDKMTEQIDLEHKHIIDQAESVTIYVGATTVSAKLLLIGEDHIPSYWDPENYRELFPNPTPIGDPHENRTGKVHIDRSNCYRHRGISSTNTE